MSGYAQQSVAGLLVEYREREDRLESHPGRNGLAPCAVLLDVDYALDPKANRVPEWARRRADEWIDGIEFDRYADPRRMPDTAFEPMLVESIPDLQTAILEAHSAEAHLVKWQGRWTSITTLMRMLDDTRAIRRIGGAMSRKPKGGPPRWLLVNAGAAHRGSCEGCGRWVQDGRVWRDLNSRVIYHEGCKEAA